MTLSLKALKELVRMSRERRSVGWTGGDESAEEPDCSEHEPRSEVAFYGYSFWYAKVVF